VDDDLADLTLAYVAAGLSFDAIAISEELTEIGLGTFEGALWPHYARLAVAQGLRAGGASARADEAAARAKRDLVAFADGIEHAEIRQAFLAIPINRAIAEAM
jgi:hypothetical protein